MYSAEFRQQVLGACDAGEGTRAVALRFQCSESWVRRVKQERRESGKTAPLTTRRRTPKWEVHREDMQRIIAERPDITLRELQEELNTKLSRSTLCLALRKLKLTFKKSIKSQRAGSAGRRQRPRVVARSASGNQPGAAGIS